MKVLASEQVIFYDIDNTIAIWGKIQKGQKSFSVTCPYTGEQYLLRPHAAHIKILKDRKSRGATNIVWSAGGYAWAKAVIEALGLQKYVTLIMSKPILYVDDKPAQEILGERLYLPFDDKYGT